MGELVRQVLVDLMKDDLIFVGADRSTNDLKHQRDQLVQIILGEIIVKSQGEAFGARQLLHSLRLRD